MSWWERAVVYQVYPRSFRDGNGDGVGDLAGTEAGLDHVAGLGADALWMSPIYPSPLADFGYDVAEFCDVDPILGSLADFDRLVRAAHDRGLRVLMDLVPCHTSIEHRWFSERPDFYIWRDGERPPNNWRATFGGPAWTRRDGRWYLHSFYPEQPDLDWRNPDVVKAMQAVVRFWLERGADGFRLDALDRLVKDARLRDDPPASAPFGLPLPAEYAELEHLYSTNNPDIRHALAALREAAGDAFLVGEVFLPAAKLTPYFEYLDAAFAFELFHAPWEASALRAAIEACGEKAAWVLSNHDFPRLPDRFGAANARAAAMLLLTLPGPAFIYQGEEIGQRDGPVGERVFDRAGRDPFRHPLQWTADPRTGGFSSADPWLAPVDAPQRNIEDQLEDPGSMLSLYRDLIALRPQLGPRLKWLSSEPGVLAYRCGELTVSIDTDHPGRSFVEGGGLLIRAGG